jgi:uncharacterized protein YndB with AHSA1/START domain
MHAMMDQKSASAPATALTKVERVSDREIVITRRIDASPRRVFQALTKADLFREWWVPRSFGLKLLSCDMDARVGGTYRLEFGHPGADLPMAFFGTYTEVIQGTRLTWTNEESPDGAITTVTLTDEGATTALAIHNVFPTSDALDAEIASGAMSCMDETLLQLEELLCLPGLT